MGHESHTNYYSVVVRQKKTDLRNRQCHCGGLTYRETKELQ